MADNSHIEWTDATWNIVTGCAVVSPGCTNCYAMKLAGTRLRNHPSRAGLTRDTKAGPAWTGEVRFNAGWLAQPLGWTRPRMIFVAAHGDLFHPDVTDEQLDQVFAVMALCPQHTFQVLTKRPERARAYLGSGRATAVAHRAFDMTCAALAENPRSKVGEGVMLAGDIAHLAAWPLPNVWLGTSVEDQARADERIPELLATPATVRWISAEPLLGPVDLLRIPGGGAFKQATSAIGAMTNTGWHQVGLHWVVVGGESGPGARPMHPDWARSLRDQCAAAGVPFFFKQWGAWLDADHRYAQLVREGWTVLRDGADWQPPKPLTFADAEFLAGTLGADFEAHSDGSTYLRLGKSRAGRLLDGVERNGVPAR